MNDWFPSEPRQPVSDEKARNIIAKTNTNNRLEGIPADAESDELSFLHLTGRISEDEYWRRIRDKIKRRLPHLDPTVVDQIGPSAEESK